MGGRMNLLPFLTSGVRDYWRLFLVALVSAALTWPVASCSGRRSANATQAAKIIAASAKVREAAAKAEIAAMAADAVRRGEAKQVEQELRKVADEKGSDAVAGPGVAAVLDRLREASRR
jgi:folate-dependent phosphoribosylglycinamide formyltransferase PurN